MSRNFLRRINDGAPQGDVINPALLAWQVLLDARSILPGTDVTAGTVRRWRDSSGAGRDCLPLGTYIGTYAASGTPNQQPVVDFNAAGGDGSGPLPAVPIDTSQGFTSMAYYFLAGFQPTGGGGFNAQDLFSSDQGAGWRLYPALYPVDANPPHPAAFVNGPTGPPANNVVASALTTTGFHILTLICQPPYGLGAGGVASLYLDGALVARDATGWQINPQTAYLVNGNAAGNILFKGSAAWLGMTNFALTLSQRIGVEAYLRKVFG